MRQTCAKWGCSESATYNKPLCYEHWKQWEAWELEECNRCHYFYDDEDFISYWDDPDDDTVLTNLKDQIDLNHVYKINKYTTSTSTTLKQVPSSPSTGEFSFFPPNKIKLGDSAVKADKYVIEYDVKVDNEEIDKIREKVIQPLLNEHFGAMTTVPFSADNIPDQAITYGTELNAIYIMMNANLSDERYRAAWNSWLERLKDVTILTVDGEVVDLSHPQIPRIGKWQSHRTATQRGRRNAW